MEYQRRILGLLYMIGGALVVLIMSIATALMFAIPVDIFAPNAVVIPEFVKMISLVSSLFLLLILGIPSILIGAALLKRKSWAFDWILVIGCFYLLFFPIGTAVGIYAFIVFFGNRKYHDRSTIASEEKVVQ